MKQHPALLFSICVLFYSVQGAAYEVDTHVLISEAAARRSSLVSEDLNILEELGLPSSIEDRSNPLPNSQGIQRNILDLIVDGARFEDGFIEDSGFSCLFSSGLSRPKNHFYDPIRDRGLYGAFNGLPSPDWALEDRNEVAEQDFSLADARTRFRLGLIGIAPEVRRNAFGGMFQMLGHVVHHIQDMAQPQHVRNDVHANLPCTDLDVPGENPSLYEVYTNVHRAMPRFAALLAQSRERVGVNRARELWVTQQGEGGTGAGIAEFTNNNFVSAGTNFRLEASGAIVVGAEYALPVPTGVAETRTIAELYTLAGEPVPMDINPDTGGLEPLEGEVDFIRSTVRDKRTGEVAPNDRASSLSVFDAELKKYNVQVKYDTGLFGGMSQTATVNRAVTLNRFNFDAAHEFLVPRAVSYSAGLIDHFFRVRLDTSFRNHARSGASGQSEVVVRNETEMPLEGDFDLYYERADGTRQRLAGQQGVRLEPKPTDGSPPDEIIIEFTAPDAGETAVALAEEVPYMVVFDGATAYQDDAGQPQLEPAVAGRRTLNGLLGFAAPDGPKSLTPRPVVLRELASPFVGSSRVRPHPSNPDLALVFDPYRDRVGVVDYASGQSLTLTAPGHDGADWRVAANWVGENQVLVATFDTDPKYNSSPEYRDAEVRFNLYDWDPQAFLLLHRGFRFIAIDQYPWVPTGPGRSWSTDTRGQRRDNPWPWDYHWWSFDVDREGTMHTIFGRRTSTARSEESRYSDPDCINSPIKTVTTTTDGRVEYRAVTVDTSGRVELGAALAVATENSAHVVNFGPPSKPSDPPDICGEGDLSSIAFTTESGGVHAAHLDITPAGDVALVRTPTSSSSTSSTVYSNTSNWTYTGEYGGQTSWSANGTALDEGMWSGSDSRSHICSNQEGVPCVDTYTSTYHRTGIQIYDLNYDGEGTPWATYVYNTTNFDSSDPSLGSDTTFYFGNAADRATLFEATAPPEYRSLEYGPPVGPADVTANPYGPGAVAVVQILPQRTGGGPNAWYAPQTRDWFVTYLDGAGPVDLYAASSASFAASQDFQFLP